MAYAKPIDVYQTLELANAVYKKELNDGSSISSGATVDLENTNIIRDGILAEEDAEVSSDRSIKLYLDGSLVDPSDYDVDHDKGEVTYSGTSSGVPEATYFYTPADIPSRIIEDRLAAAEEMIDNKTNTTFGGTNTVTDEIYSGTGRSDQLYILDKRPVDTVTSVEVNDAEVTEPDNWTSATSGGGNDYLEIEGLGVKFIDGEYWPANRRYAMRVTYDYGHSDVPADIKDLAILYVIEKSQKLQIMAANTKGRDNFDPETTGVLDVNQQDVIDQYRVARHSKADISVDQAGSIT